MEAPRACGIVTLCLRGLAAIHAKRIVHRDLKLLNIVAMTGEEDCDVRVKIVDLGLAIGVVGEDGEAPRLTLMSRSADVEGTPEFMSPEQHRGLTATPLVDVWAIGVCFHVLVGGVMPFSVAGGAQNP